jgi:REP element-mobilizing transposase RayT
MEFADDELAATFVKIFWIAMRRDEAVVLAWSLLGNHYHLVVRQGPVPLSRSMKTLQQRFTRTRNLRSRIFGPLWQGRFKAKDVDDERYLMQLIAYVHLNPVKTGLAKDAGEYRWSGHQDVESSARHLSLRMSKAVPGTFPFPFLRIPLDNNAAERALRGVVVGRGNHYGSKSKRGTEVAALFYALFETAKLSGVDPRAYVTLAAKRAIAEHGAVTLPSDLT